MTKSIECFFCNKKYCNHCFSLYSDGSIYFYYYFNDKRYIFDFNKTKNKILVYGVNGFKIEFAYIKPSKEVVESIIKNLIFE